MSTGHLLIVDPRHLPDDIAAALTVPSPYVVPLSASLAGDVRRRMERNAETARRNAALDGFLSDVLVADHRARMDRTVVSRLFRQYAEEHGRRDLLTWSARALYSALDGRGYSSHASGGKRFIRGLRRVGTASASLDDVLGAQGDHA